MSALAQEVERLDADLEMLADRALVEGVGLAGQLDLAVQRLVGDAEQGAVGHAEAIALGGDGADSMSIATARDWLKRSADRVKRSSQLRSSVVTTVPVRRRCFSILRLLAGDLDGGVEQRAATSAMAGIGISVGSTSSRTWSSRR